MIVVFVGERITVTVEPVKPYSNACIAFADCFVEHLREAGLPRPQRVDRRCVQP